jgi:putative membrane protein (TIGR04086 family)
MSKHKSRKMNIDIPTTCMTLLKANVMAYALTTIYILFGAILLTYTNLNPKVEQWIVLIGIVASAFLAGFDTAKMMARNGYKWGAMGGVAYLIIFIILSFVTNGVSSLSLGTLLCVTILAIVSSAIAGMIAVNVQK